MKSLFNHGIKEWSHSKEILLPIVRVNIYHRSQQGKMVSVLSYSGAGSPIHTQERFEENIFIPKGCIEDENVIAVKIRGDSMKDIGIDDGSIVLTKIGEYFRSGVIGMVTLSDEYDYGTTCKKIVKEHGYYRLISMNDEKNYEDKIIKEGDLRYIGEVVAIYQAEYD